MSSTFCFVYLLVILFQRPPTLTCATLPDEASPKDSSKNLYQKYCVDNINAPFTRYRLENYNINDKQFHYCNITEIYTKFDNNNFANYPNQLELSKGLEEVTTTYKFFMNARFVLDNYEKLDKALTEHYQTMDGWDTSLKETKNAITIFIDEKRETMDYLDKMRMDDNNVMTIKGVIEKYAENIKLAQGLCAQTNHQHNIDYKQIDSSVNYEKTMEQAMTELKNVTKTIKKACKNLPRVPQLDIGLQKLLKEYDIIQKAISVHSTEIADFKNQAAEKYSLAGVFIDRIKGVSFEKIDANLKSIKNATQKFSNYLFNDVNIAIEKFDLYLKNITQHRPSLPISKIGPFEIIIARMRATISRLMEDSSTVRNVLKLISEMEQKIKVLESTHLTTLYEAIGYKQSRKLEYTVFASLEYIIGGLLKQNIDYFQDCFNPYGKNEYTYSSSRNLTNIKSYVYEMDIFDNKIIDIGVANQQINKKIKLNLAKLDNERNKLEKLLATISDDRPLIVEDNSFKMENSQPRHQNNTHIKVAYIYIPIGIGLLILLVIIGAFFYREKLPFKIFYFKQIN